ncbi:MAG: hypothetical protein GY705_12315 [Bacteroidetes bacterium]|nr:hypothetical protein [Bacteroidota bacterium]
MKVFEYIKNIVDKFQRGYVFTYRNFSIEEKNKEAGIKALNRMVASGKITKLSKGRYYKPEISPFGALPPSQFQVVKDLLGSGDEIQGYLTGLSVYSELGLTTQVGSTIQIGRHEVRSTFKRGKYTISFLKQKNTITKKNIPLLRLLDALRLIKKIPDATTRDSCLILKKLIEELSENEQEVTVRLALKYQPSTRALLGAILTDLGRERVTGSLRKSLNPITLYDISEVQKVLQSAEAWRIK